MGRRPTAEQPLPISQVPGAKFELGANNTYSEVVQHHVAYSSSKVWASWLMIDQFCCLRICLWG